MHILVQISSYYSILYQQCAGHLVIFTKQPQNLMVMLTIISSYILNSKFPYFSLTASIEQNKPYHCLFEELTEFFLLASCLNFSKEKKMDTNRKRNRISLRSSSNEFVIRLYSLSTLETNFSKVFCSQ